MDKGVDVLDGFDFEAFLATEEPGVPYPFDLDSIEPTNAVPKMSGPPPPLPPNTYTGGDINAMLGPPKPMDSSIIQPNESFNNKLDDRHSDVVKNITISRDTTSGSNFQKEKLVALNHSAPSETRQASAALPPGIIPNIRGPPTPSFQHGGPELAKSLQDHQMQLMLLEQQNKKRLLVTRREQDFKSIQHTESAIANIFPASTCYDPKEYQQQVMEPEQENKRRQAMIPKSDPPHNEPVDFSQPFVQGAPIQFQPLPQGLTPGCPTALQPNSLPAPFPPPNVETSALKKKKKKRTATADLPDQSADQVRRLLGRIRALEEENDELKEAHGMPRKPPQIQVFYCLQGDTQTYLEPPTWYIGPDEKFRLKGHSPITSKDRFLQSHRHIALYVDKYYSSDNMPEEVKKIVRQGGNPPPPKADFDNISLETDEMIDALEEFFSQQPRFREEFPEMVGKTSRLLEAPYIFWYRYRSPTALDNLEPRYQELMKLLTDWIEENYLEDYERAEALFDAGLVTKNVMKYFVAPGDVIIKEHNKSLEAFLATGWCTLRPQSTARESWDTFVQGGSETRKAPASKWHVFTWQYGFDGKFYKDPGYVEFELRAHKEDEEIKITDLKSYPLRFADEATRAKLETRGRTFWDCRSKKLVARQEEGDDAALLGTGERFMIDYPTYKMIHSDSPLNDPVHDRIYIPTRMMNMDQPPESPNVYLFPRLIIGYNLRLKKWEELEVDRIRNVVWNKKAFEHLVVEPGIKELVQALVTNQISTEKSTDLIQNKGNGLVMLLHGGPGTGKTFTAESVAEMAEKPLFRVTCGDIGTEAESVEKYLESVLHLGRNWGCVVLLDEADVFLEQRTLNDLTRNALVSVFLRVLEYYDGILLLTSNRVGTFDEAFKSRIQLALHYESLNRDQRSQIWANFFNRLKNLGEKNIDYYDVEGYIDVLADHEMNGRQIRNAITTARQLAQFQGHDMAYVHLKHVITVASKFDRHLSNIQNGMSEEGGSVRDDETNISKYTWANWKNLTLDETQQSATDGKA